MLFINTEKSVLLSLIFVNVLGPIISSVLAMTTLSDLTPREIEILQLVLTGRTNKAIAVEVFISEKTVEFHLDNIYTKIGVRTRLMAGLWALQHGIRQEAREIPS